MFDTTNKPLYTSHMDQKEFARMGGYAVKKIYGNQHFKELARKSVESRKAKKAQTISPIDNG